MEDIIDAAVITGHTGHLGSALVSELTMRGVPVLGLSRRRTDWIDTHRPSVVTDGCDLTTPEGLRFLADAVTRYVPGHFHLVNSVGYFPGYGPFTEAAVNDLHKVVDSNLTALLFAAFTLLPLMVDRGGGHFVTFSSLSRQDAFPLMTAFDTVKASVEQFTRHVAHEFGDRGVHANCMALATLKTQDEIAMKPHGDHEHWIDPGEVAKIVSHLMLGQLSLVNGNIINCYHHSATYYKTSFYDRVTK